MPLYLVQLQHAHRNGNHSADLLAKARIKTRESLVLYSNPPNFVVSQLLVDAWDTTYLSVFGYREEKKEREKNIYFFYLVCKWKGKEKYMFLPLCPYICLFDVFIDIFV